jgi:hypothetical protein
MTPEEIAKRILSDLGITDPAHIDEDIYLIVTAFKDAIAAEREACAKIAEDEHLRGAVDVTSLEFHYGKQIAAAIRARTP